MKDADLPVELVRRVLHELRRVVRGETAEIRVLKSRKGVEVFITERESYGLEHKSI